jgi:hypothetical protein
MPLILNVGLSRKVGLPSYSSIGASCHVQVELEPSLLQNDLELFQHHVRNAYVACAQAVADELSRHDGTGGRDEATPQRLGSQSTNGQVPHEPAPSGGFLDEADLAERRPAEPGREAGRRVVRLATPFQVRAICAIANRHGLDLAELLKRRYGVQRPDELSVADASDVIGELKATTNGAGGER